MSVQPTPHHIANALWQIRHRFLFLHAKEFATEIQLYNEVKRDLEHKMFHDYATAVDFYLDLNQHGVEA